MEKLKLKIHPLFVLIGALSCFTGRLPTFLTLVFSALFHECAHSVVAAKRGYGLNEIMLTPYGANVSGDLSGISARDELAVITAGPLASAALCLLSAASWWFFPDCYPYTENVFYVNAALFAVNLLPAFPLDGGRAAKRILVKFFGTKRGGIVSEITGGIIAIGLIAFSAAERNISALALALFLLFGLNSGKYEKLPFPPANALSRGAEERRVAVREGVQIKKILRFLSADRYLTLDVYSAEGEYLYSLRQEEIEKIFLEEGLYAAICEKKLTKSVK